MPYSPPKTGSFSRGKLFIIALGGHFILQRSNAVLWGNQKQGRTKVTTVFPCVSFLEPQKRNGINVFISNVRNQHTGASVTRLLGIYIQKTYARLLPTLTARAILGRTTAVATGAVSTRTHHSLTGANSLHIQAASGCSQEVPEGQEVSGKDGACLASDSLRPCFFFPPEGSFAGLLWSCVSSHKLLSTGPLARQIFLLGRPT